MSVRTFTLHENMPTEGKIAFSMPSDCPQILTVCIFSAIQRELLDDVFTFNHACVNVNSPLRYALRCDILHHKSISSIQFCRQREHKVRSPYH